MHTSSAVNCHTDHDLHRQTNIEQGISEFLNRDKTVKAGPLKANPQKAV